MEVAQATLYFHEKRSEVLAYGKADYWHSAVKTRPLHFKLGHQIFCAFLYTSEMIYPLANISLKFVKVKFKRLIYKVFF